MFPSYHLEFCFISLYNTVFFFFFGCMDSVFPANPTFKLGSVSASHVYFRGKNRDPLIFNHESDVPCEGGVSRIEFLPPVR